jgi:hypothetical protein
MFIVLHDVLGELKCRGARSGRLASENHFLKSDGQFSISVIGAVRCWGAVLITNLLPSPDHPKQVY